MNLIPSSFAAVSHNPNLHLVVHIIGTLKGHNRSANARYVPGANEGSAKNLALWITLGLDQTDDAYMWYQTDTTRPQMKDWEDKRQEEERRKHQANDPDTSSQNMSWEENDDASCAGSDEGDFEDPSSPITPPTIEEIRNANTPEAFYRLGAEKHWMLPPEILESFKRRIAQNKYRPNSIGNWLQTMLK